MTNALLSIGAVAASRAELAGFGSAPIVAEPVLAQRDATRPDLSGWRRAARLDDVPVDFYDVPLTFDEGLR